MDTYVKVNGILYKNIDTGLAQDEINVFECSRQVGDIRYILDNLYRVLSIGRYKPNLHVFTKQRYDFTVHWVKV